MYYLFIFGILLFLGKLEKVYAKGKYTWDKKVNENYFTGNIIISEILGEDNSAEQEMYHVTFQNGALTTLHFHGSDQILIATNGKALFL